MEQHKEQFEFASKLGKAIKEDGYEMEVLTICTIEVQVNDFEAKVTTNDFDTSLRNAYFLWRKTKECSLLEQHAKESGITWTTHTKDICLGNTKPSSQESKDVWGLYDMSGNVSEFAFQASHYVLGGSVIEKSKCGLIEGVSCKECPMIQRQVFDWFIHPIAVPDETLYI